MIKHMAKKVGQLNKAINEHTKKMTVVRDNLRLISKEQNNTFKDMKTICTTTLERNIAR